MIPFKNKKQILCVSESGSASYVDICNLEQMSSIKRLEIDSLVDAIDLLPDDRTIAYIKKNEKNIFLLDLITGAMKVLEQPHIVNSLIVTREGDLVFESNQTLHKITFKHIKELNQFANSENVDLSSIDLIKRRLSVPVINASTQLPLFVCRIVEDYLDTSVPLNFSNIYNQHTELFSIKQVDLSTDKEMKEKNVDLKFG